MPEPLVNFNRITDSFGDDEDFIREIYTVYLEDGTERLAHFAKAVADNDVNEISRLAHAFKGSSSNVGADGVRSISSEMEINANASKLDGMDSAFGKLQQEFECAREFIESHLESLGK